ncbi:MAG: K(+)-transporting ATPase subunit C [Microcoleaceae cyanobacterium]
MLRELIVGFRSTLALWVLTALVYPFFMIFLGQVMFSNQANGSLITNSQGQIVGSALIGQTFTSPQYFRSRPSAVNYSEGADAQPTGLSGASNLAPNNPALLERVQETVAKLKQAGIQPQADLVYSSGSGLDPHISPEAAQAQIQRIATTRSLDPNQLELLIVKNTERRFLGIFGEPGVNVLKLNLAVDALQNPPA